MIDYSLILTTNFLGKAFVLVGRDYEGLDWQDQSPKPTQAELDALWEATQTAQAAKKQAATTAKQSAISKLAKLGLTDTEIKALTGN